MGHETHKGEEDRDKESNISYPRLIREIDVLGIFEKREEKPCDHHNEDRIEVECEHRESLDRHEEEAESSDREEKRCIVEKKKEREGALCDDEPDLEIFTRILEESFTDVLDFNHFSL